MSKEEALAGLSCFMEETLLSSRVSNSNLSLSAFLLLSARARRAVLACFVGSNYSCLFRLWGSGKVTGAWMSTSVSAACGGQVGIAMVGSSGFPTVYLFGFSSFWSFRVFTSADMSCIRWLFHSWGTPGAWPLAEFWVTSAIEPSSYVFVYLSAWGMWLSVFTLTYIRISGPR